MHGSQEKYITCSFTTVIHTCLDLCLCVKNNWKPTTSHSLLLHSYCTESHKRTSAVSFIHKRWLKNLIISSISIAVHLSSVHIHKTLLEKDSKGHSQLLQTMRETEKNVDHIGIKSDI